MPSTGMPSSKIFGSQCGAPGSYTLDGPPDRMIPFGFNSFTRSAGRSWRTTWQKTFCSRTRRAISWPYCEPKSRISTRSLSERGVMAAGCLLVREPGEQLLQRGLVLDLAGTHEALDVDRTLLDDVDFPVLAGDPDGPRDGAFAVGGHLVRDPGGLQPPQEGENPIEPVLLHVSNR